MADAFPLAWPDGWPRTPAADQKDGRTAFKRQQDTGRGYRSGEPWTFAAARDALVDEIWRHGAKTCVVSTNFPIGRNNLPREDRRRPADQAVAIYFQRQGKPYAMACDRYRDAEGNMRSLTLALAALRTLERHGGGLMMERAYAGFAALPPPKRPHEILGVSAIASRDDIQRAWRTKIAEAHPDQTGSHEAAAEINAARDAMLKQIGAQS